MNEIVLKAVLKIIHTHYDTLSTRAIIISSISYEYIQDSCLASGLASVWQMPGSDVRIRSCTVPVWFL